MTPNVRLQLARKRFIKRFQRIGWNTTPGDAAFLRLLIESTRARRGLEIGVATGYGAISMGLGFERTGGRLTSVEIDPEMAKISRQNLAKVQLQKVVTVVEGDALAVIPRLRGPFDFVFIDAVKKDYLNYFRAIEPKLKARAVIVADNVIQHADAMQDFFAAVARDPACQSVVIRASEEKGDGMAVIYRMRQRPGRAR